MLRRPPRSTRLPSPTVFRFRRSATASWDQRRALPPARGSASTAPRAAPCWRRELVDEVGAALGPTRLLVVRAARGGGARELLGHVGGRGMLGERTHQAEPPGGEDPEAPPD